MNDLVTLYNPANASALSEEQIAGLQNLSSAEIKELATAYPNTTMQRAYLLIVDKTRPPEKQLPTLSSFENLWNLREKNGMKNYVAYGFKGVYKSRAAVPVRNRRQEVLDLSEKELMSLPGFKTATRSEPPQQVPITKVNKAVKEEVKIDMTPRSTPTKTATKKAATKKTKSK